ncbi:MAG: TRAP transporter fused permease subunit [Hyphomicrobiales bacterium]
MHDAIKSSATLRNLTLVLSLVMFSLLVNYFMTGAGGPRLLAVRLVPLAVIIQLLVVLQQRLPYPRAPAALNYLLVLAYAGICLYAIGYLNYEYENVSIWRQGSYNTHDFIVGLLIFAVVMEVSRLFHPILFWVNVVLIAYTLWGYMSPIDFFWHPGVSLERVITSSTVEFSTGVYGRYAQLAITLIAAFLLLAAAASGFGAQSAVIQVMRRLAGRSRHTIPQTAVLASVSIGMVSGSGSANTAVTGSFTIPLMKRYGFPGAFAGAVETAASMGGLIMPPLMAVAGFLMAEFLGVPYWDVVMRGFAVAFVYFASLILAVYLLSVRLLSPDPVPVPAVPIYAQVKTAIFFAAVVYLMVLMGWWGYGALRAALFTAVALFFVLLAAYLFFAFVLKDPEAVEDPDAEPEYFVGPLLVVACLVFAWLDRGDPTGAGIWIAAAAGFGILAVAVPSLIRAIRTIIEAHADLTSYLTVLMAVLGIMIGLFTVTGFINRMGSILLHLGDWHIMATILMAWIFGWLVGTGLPPTATYIIVAIIIVPPLRELGIDPWVAHFFAFLLAIWGELSPPTSLTAAVASRIADASFMRTMYEALKICLPITVMTFAIFIRSDMVVTPGWGQVYDTLLVAVGTCGLTFATFGRFVGHWGGNAGLKAALALGSLLVVFHPTDAYAVLAAAFVAPAVIFGVSRHRLIAGPASSIAPQPAK